jgi:two-component system, NarL family, nitrate/nitrite response regulator NarL
MQPAAVPTAIINLSALSRAGFVHILAGSRFRVKANCSSLSDLWSSAFSDKCCVALISLDGMAAVAVLSQLSALKEKYKGLHVIALTERVHPAEEVVATIAAGAAGYLFKNEINPDTLVKSLELVLLGRVIISPGLTKSPREGVRQPASDAAQTDDMVRLSDREQMILKQLTYGAPNKCIARKLNIAEATVKVHIKSLLRKIRVDNRTQAAMWAVNQPNALGQNKDTEDATQVRSCRGGPSCSTLATWRSTASPAG